jgi:hypothetical protein
MPLRRTVLSAIALTLCAGLANAQQADPAVGRRPLNLLAMQGPPEPEAFARTIGLDARQTVSYGNLRRAYLAATRAERDSLEVMRTRMREMRASGQAVPGQQPGVAANRRGAGMQAMRPLADTLEARFTDFETDLAFLLSPEQQKKYEAWKEAEMARMRNEMRERRP